jgi:hypothetical protein
MKIDYAVLCDSCSAENGKHFIHGGGWDVVFTDALPVEYPQLCVAVRLLFDAGDRSRGWDLEMDVVGPDDESVLPGGVRGRIEPQRGSVTDADTPTAQCLGFRAVYARLSRPGPHAAVLRVEGSEVRRLPFRVEHVAREASAVTSTPRTTDDRDGGRRWLWSGSADDGSEWLWRPGSGAG